MFPDVNDDLLFEILLRLPTTILVQAKVLCREWRDLIASPLFVRAQHARAMSQHPGILTSCCGIICFHDIVEGPKIANPITCEYLRLPQVPDDATTYPPLSIGFDHVAGTYKVVGHQPDQWSLLVITVGDQSWRWVGFPRSRCYINPLVPKCRSGRMIWQRSKKSFLLFDLVSETFRCWSEVGGSEYWDTTRRPTWLGPQYLPVDPVHTYHMSESVRCKVCGGGEEEIFPPLLRERGYTKEYYVNVAGSWRPGRMVLWDYDGLREMPSPAGSDGIPGGEEQCGAPLAIHECNENILQCACLHHASLISPNQMAGLRSRLGDD